MMTNLFSSFNPSTYPIFSLNWASSLLIMILVPHMFWFIPSRINFIWNFIISLMHKECVILIKNPKLKSSTLVLSSLFIIIMINNFMGLFPYIFTCSSHLNFSLTLSLPLWLSLMILSWSKNTIHMLAHLVPQGAPNMLLPFLVIVETISNLIRPGTLAIRLTANMIAGHLLITLLSNIGGSLTIIPLTSLILMQILLLILESAVAIIQSCVFSILLALYSSEI